MNFSRKSTYQKQKAFSQTNRHSGKKAGVSALRVAFYLLLLIGTIGLCSFVGIFRGIIDNAPDIKDVNIVPSGYATYIYDVDGNQLQKLTAPNSNRTSVSITNIPLDLQHAVVAVEDERFYQHNGIDVRGILRAFVVGVKNGFHFSEGASTITQQLLKNNVFTSWTSESTMVESLRRKFQEQYLALQLEKELTAQGSDCKEIILENYLNTINLGAGCYGVQAAAQRYFNKDVKDLTLSECTVLAGITQNPTAFNPISHPDKNAVRREKVLNNMRDQGYITQEQYDECLADNVYERIAAASEVTGETQVYSYFIDELTSQIVNDLQTQKGYTEELAYQALYSGGLQIYTTQDPDIQLICDEEYTNPENFPSGTQYSMDWALTINKPDGSQVNYSKEMLSSYFQESDPSFDLLFDTQEEAQSYIDMYKAAIMTEGDEIAGERSSFSPQPQSSIVIMDQATGYVKAIVGGRGPKEASLTLNRATNTTRQPGSTFKILAAYAPAIDMGELNLASIITDEPYEYANGRPVKNWLTDTYQGDITVREAINQSVNVCAIKTITQITPQTAYDFLLTLGFSTLVDYEVKNGSTYSDIVQPLALGGLTYGVTNLELTAAYAAIANGGEYIKPLFYTKILDKNGNVLIDNTSKGTRVIKESTAYLLTSAMETVVTEGTGTALQLDHMPVAGKTGTTSDSNDVWFAGFTPYYTCTVWAGYDNNENLPDYDPMYQTYHKILWNKIMSRIHENLPTTNFSVPASVEKATICTATGKLATSSCPSITEYFDKSSIPTQRCSGHYVYQAPTVTPTPELEVTVTPTPTETPTEAPTETPTEVPTDGSDDTHTNGNHTDDPNHSGNDSDSSSGTSLQQQIESWWNSNHGSN